MDAEIFFPISKVKTGRVVGYGGIWHLVDHRLSGLPRCVCDASIREETGIRK